MSRLNNELHELLLVGRKENLGANELKQVEQEEKMVISSIGQVTPNSTLTTFYPLTLDTL